MESDEGDFSLSGLTQNTFLPNRIILDDELSIIANILESENRDFVVYKVKEPTSEILVMPNRQNKRNISLINDDELEKRKESQIPLNTKHIESQFLYFWR